MSNIFDAIKERRSIRKYKARSVPKELIEEVLVAAGWAPSAHNSQPWRFIVLDDPLIKREISKAMAESWAEDLSKEGIEIRPKVHKMRVERFATAPALILACTTMVGMKKFSDKRRSDAERDLVMQSLGAALQSMLLAINEKGLGACWFCAPSFCKPTVRRVLKIPEEIEPEALITIGYPAEKPLPPSRKLISEYSFKDKWGKGLN